MATKLRRRFPWLALLAVVVLTIASAAAIAELEPVPQTWEMLVDRRTASVHVRCCVGSLQVLREEAEDWNCISHQYTDLEGRSMGNPEWQLLYRCCTWMRRSQADSYFIDVELYTAILQMTDYVDPAPIRIGGASTELSSDVRDCLVVSFVELLQTGAVSTSVSGYVCATREKLAEYREDFTIDDVIPLDTWLADPVPEHYFGPDRIH